MCCLPTKLLAGMRAGPSLGMKGIDIGADRSRVDVHPWIVQAIRMPVFVLHGVLLLSLFLRAQAQVSTNPSLGDWSSTIQLPIIPVAAAVRNDGAVRLLPSPASFALTCLVNVLCSSAAIPLRC